MRKEKSCGAIVYAVKDGTRHFLLIEHVNGGHWAFPKGHVENNESEEETALREIQEETGLSVTLDTGFREINVYAPMPDVTKDVIYFLAEAHSVDIVKQDIEVTSFKWLSFDDAIDQLTYNNDIEILRSANKYLDFNGN